MRVHSYIFIFFLCCLLQSTLAQENSVQTNATETGESFFSVSIDPGIITSLPFIVELQAGWKDGYVMQRFGMDFPLLNYDYDVSLVVPIGESGLSPYFGVGVDTINLLAFAIAFDAHAGLEIQLEEVAIFTEYEATSLLDGKSFQSLSVGLKFYQ